ncbi:MAG: HD domain-containing protein [Candidatus Margulisiibacteriota bacterium]
MKKKIIVLNSSLPAKDPLLARFIREASGISKTYYLSIDLGQVISNLEHALPSEHFQSLLTDQYHGFTHALTTVRYALELCTNTVLKNNVALGALLHDINGVECSLFSRDEHQYTGAELVVEKFNQIIRFLDVTREISVEAVLTAVFRHQDDVAKFQGIPMDVRDNIVSAIVRDADTIDEGMNIPRIVAITESYALKDNLGLERPLYKVAYNKHTSDMERLAILLTEEASVRDAKENDLMMFLLRNITKSIDPANFVTAPAKMLMANNSMYEKNLKAILESLDSYRFSGDYDRTFGGKKEIGLMLARVSGLYNKFKTLGLMPKAKSIVERFTKNGRESFDLNKDALIGKLEALLKAAEL